MNLEITEHALERMKKYNISKELLSTAVEKPDSIVGGYSGRKIYQKQLNGYALRVIIEESKGIKTIITLYKSRSERYGI